MKTPRTATEILTMAEVSQRYPKQWVLVGVTNKDDSGFPAKGEVILSSPNEDEALKKAATLKHENKAKNLKQNLYFFYTGTIDDNDRKNPLDSQKKAILSDLLRIKAATPLQFEVRSGRIGEADIEDNLLELVKMGYVNVDDDCDGNYNDLKCSVFYPTWKTRWLRIIGTL